MIINRKTIVFSVLVFLGVCYCTCLRIPLRRLYVRATQKSFNTDEKNTVGDSEVKEEKNRKVK